MTTDAIKTDARKRDARKSSFLSYLSLFISILAGLTAIYLAYSVNPSVKDTTILLVQDNITGQGVVGAVVSVEVAGEQPLDSNTDSRGFVQFVIPDSFWDRPGRIIVEAEGYQKYVQNIDLAVEPLPNIIELES